MKNLVYKYLKHMGLLLFLSACAPAKINYIESQSEPALKRNISDLESKNKNLSKEIADLKTQKNKLLLESDEIAVIKEKSEKKLKDLEEEKNKFLEIFSDIFQKVEIEDDKDLCKQLQSFEEMTAKAIEKLKNDVEAKDEKIEEFEENFRESKKTLTEILIKSECEPNKLNENLELKEVIELCSVQFTYIFENLQAMLERNEKRREMEAILLSEHQKLLDEIERLKQQSPDSSSEDIQDIENYLEEEKISRKDSSSIGS